MKAACKFVLATCIAATLALSACSAPPPPQSPPGPPAIAVPAVPTKPADPLADARSRAASIDILSSLELRHFELAPEKPGWEKRKVSMFRKSGEVVKIIATEPTDSGKMSGESVYYLASGAVFYYEAPFNHMVFSNGRIVLITDEKLNPLTMQDKDLRLREAAVAEAVKKYLALMK